MPFGAPSYTVPKSGWAYFVAPIVATKAAELASTGSVSIATFHTLLSGNIGQPASVGVTPAALPLATQVTSANNAVRIRRARCPRGQALPGVSRPSNRLSVDGEALASVALGRDMAHPLRSPPDPIVPEEARFPVRRRRSAACPCGTL